MASTSNIAWTDSTFNPVIGCTKVGPGCDNCYAEVSTPSRAMKIKWGAGQKRYRTSAANWNQPLAWNRAAEKSGKRRRVFCASLADVFDNEWPDGARNDLWCLINKTPMLDWLLLTKRIVNVSRMVPRLWVFERFPTNVRIIITVCNQLEADRDIPKLLALGCKNGISYEPALGPVDFVHAANQECRHEDGFEEPDTGALVCKKCEEAVDMDIDWIIIGGESKQGSHAARPFDMEWARDTIAQCNAAGVPVFMKQIGSNPVQYIGPCGVKRDRAGADPSEWPEDLRVREFPE